MDWYWNVILLLSSFLYAYAREYPRNYSFDLISLVSIIKGNGVIRRIGGGAVTPSEILRKFQNYFIFNGLWNRYRNLKLYSTKIDQPPSRQKNPVLLSLTLFVSVRRTNKSTSFGSIIMCLCRSVGRNTRGRHNDSVFRKYNNIHI